MPLGEFTGNRVADHPRDRVSVRLQFTCWKIFAVALIAAQVSCTKDALETRRTDNTSVTVDLLFTNDGCAVYRFEDGGRDHYYTDCRGTTRTGHVENCGKSCTQTVYEDIPSSGRK